MYVYDVRNTRTHNTSSQRIQTHTCIPRAPGNIYLIRGNVSLGPIHTCTHTTHTWCNISYQENPASVLFETHIRTHARARAHTHTHTHALKCTPGATFDTRKPPPSDCLKPIPMPSTGADAILPMPRVTCMCSCMFLFDTCIRGETILPYFEWPACVII